MRRPKQDEVAPYFNKYVLLVKEENIVKALKKGGRQMLKFLEGIDPAKRDYSYAEGKWTLKESVIHIIDTERIMAYRALRIARGDQTPLAGFDQDDYVPFYNAGNRSWESVLKEYKQVRKASLSLLKSFEEADYDRMGTASNHPISVLALAYIIAGHEKHHYKIIKEKYLVMVN